MQNFVASVLSKCKKKKLTSLLLDCGVSRHSKTTTKKTKKIDNILEKFGAISRYNWKKNPNLK